MRLIKLTPVSRDELDVRSLASIAGELNHSTSVHTVHDSDCFPGPSNPEPYWPPYRNEWFELIREEAAPAIDDEGVIHHLPNGAKYIENQRLFVVSLTISLRYRQYAVLLAKYSLALPRIADGDMYVGEKIRPDAYAAYVAAIDQDNRARPLTAEESAALWDTLREERVTYQVLFESNEATQERRVTLLRPEVGPKRRWAERIRNLSYTSASLRNRLLFEIRVSEERFPDSLDHLAAEIALAQSTNTPVREMPLSFADVRQAIERRQHLVTSQEEAMKLFQPFITKDGRIAATAATARYAESLINSLSVLQINAFGVNGLVLIDAEYHFCKSLNVTTEHQTYLCKRDSRGLYRPLSATERERALNGIEKHIWSTDQVYQLYEELKDLL